MAQTEALMQWWGLSPDAFASRLVVDIGAGSRLRSRYFEGASIAAIEPLADRFVSEIEWCDLASASELYATPAEDYVESLGGRAAFVMCVNVLDHVYEPQAVVGNAFRCLQPGGQFLLAVDLHEKGHAGHMHPVHLDRAGVRSMLERVGFAVRREFDGLYPARADSFGHGSAFSVLAERLAGSSSG